MEQQTMFYDIPADYKSYLPEIYQDTVEVDAIASAINSELDNISAKIKEMVNNKFPMSSDETGIARWEKILGVASPLNSDLEFRRAAVHSAMMAQPPINEKMIRGIIEAYMNMADMIDFSVNGYIISVRYRGSRQMPDLTPLYATIYRLIPATMLLNIAYAYLTWNELDAQNLTFVELDDKDLTIEEFERGEFIE